MSGRPIVVLSLHWDHGESEVGFVTRSIAGAASRCADVAVGAPGPAGTTRPDGAFDVVLLGERGSLRLPRGFAPKGSVIVVDEATSELTTLAVASEPHANFYLTRGEGEPGDAWHPLELVERPGQTVPSIYLSVPVNRLAERHRHHGFGFTDYFLVLSAGAGAGAVEGLPDAAAWLTAAFPEHDVVVVEDAKASAWKNRSLRGTVPVTTRMDLWRLLAHARVCVDVGPGPLIARECVEALRFATPIIVPSDSGVAAVHAAASGGATYSEPAELLGHVARLEDATERSEMARRARSYGDDQYGDPARFVASVVAALTPRLNDQTSV
jgi:hypothetical protein